MDLVVKSRHCAVPDRFRQHVGDKLAKIERMDPKVIRLDVEVSQEHNPRQSDNRDRVELTCISRGPVIRAEAVADDPYAALDLACTRLEMRLRKAADRRRVHHGGRRPVSLAATATDGSRSSLDTGEPPVAGAPLGSGIAVVTDDGEAPEEAPVVVREKMHRSEPMTIDQALLEMELVGHDFFLFEDVVSRLPSVVYRRRGYHYGVIRLAH